MQLEVLDAPDTQNSVVRFCVNKVKSTDEDDDWGTASTIVPFQIAYAVSIHKVQGLEYSSVKLVITDEVDELITHNIFYTAITRAQHELKIYWTPEVEKKILQRIRPLNIDADVEILRTFTVGMMVIKYDHRTPLQILRIMQVPVMAGIPAHDRHIIGIRGDDVEILRIQAFQVFTVEHRQPPSRQTTLPERA